MNLAITKRYLVIGTVLTLIIILLILSTDNASAQQRKPTAGIKGGLNVSNFYSEDITDKDARLGFHVGLYGQLLSSDFFALQPELHYSTRGTEVISDGVVNQKTRFNLNYLDLPVLAVFKLGNTVELQAGAYGAYLLGANIKSEGDLGDSFDELDRDNFKSFDYGLTGGIGFNFGSVQLGGRYNLGLQKLANSDGAKAALGDAKNSVGQIYLAIPLK
jgi:hypothetical protein